MTLKHHASALPFSDRMRRTQARAYQLKRTGTRRAGPFMEALFYHSVGISPTDSRLLNIEALDAVDEKPNQTAYLLATQVLELADLFDINPMIVTASAEGGVGICFEEDGKYADIECFNSGEIWALISDRVNPASTWPVKETKADIASALLRIQQELAMTANA